MCTNPVIASAFDASFHLTHNSNLPFNEPRRRLFFTPFYRRATLPTTPISTGDNGFRVCMFNVSPEEVEELAVETEYRRK
ncbi:MAG: hypothetical protein LC730_07000 [Acidobacteria bacterium]|nr:hypothetical protein [Acidobacteriota bacterium]